MKYDVIHLVHRPRGIAVETIAADKALRVFSGDEFGMSFAMKMALLWAMPRARTIYCHRKDGTVDFKITVEHIGGKRII